MWSELDALIDQAGLAHAGELIQSLVRPAIRLHTQPDAKETRSHLGGLPLLPPSRAWPLDADGAPMACVAQIDLAEVSDYDLEHVLPRDGLLAFFGTPEHLVVASAGADRGWWRVEYVAPSEPVAQAEPPSDQFDPTIYGRVDLVPTLELSLPDLEFWGPREPLLAPIVGDAAANWQQYADLRSNLARISGGTQPVHRMLGYPWPIQADPIPDDPLEAPPRKRLLLQVDDEYYAGMTFGDSGCLYYLISSHDLSARRFDQVDLTAQCT